MTVMNDNESSKEAIVHPKEGKKQKHYETEPDKYWMVMFLSAFKSINSKVNFSCEN